ncbi:DDT domain-containing isoform A [Chlorella sorokiniana]|uniref:DDT domain-containing isoform A n=1 Tax=Chlorella sorokiniana TaxID=3076 RepID=A0A2P6TPP0_CHLSO|nr:DDT domain-containing isoform A [Chlorella sorokiniana]|eukprot:PRW55979.1 DDT domain-containing isoform A [Chlorella sorokiniana]
MPLLNRKDAWTPLDQPEGLQPEEEVWHIESTGEAFRSYEAYLQRMELYKQGVWSCKYTGKGGLTFEEAQQAEAKAVKQLDSFPKEQEERVCRRMHHSMAKIDELVASIYDMLRPAAPAEPAQQAEQAEQQPSPFGSKENEPQQGGAAAAAAAGEKPAGSGGEAAAAEAAAAGAAGEEAAAAAAAEPATAKKPEAEAEAAAEGKAAGEAKSSRKPKTPRAPVSKQLLRIFIIGNAEQQGPEHATKQVWVVKPELRQRYSLAEEIPEDIQAALAASVKAPKRKLEAPKGLGTKLPSKKDKKEKAAAGGEAAGAAGGEAAAGEGGATPAAAGAKKEKEAVPMQRVEAKSLEEVEWQYKEGTLKAHLVAVLKAVQPEALNVQGIMDKGKELGVHEFEEKQKAAIGQALATDPNFIRLSKGAYSLHCFHPDKEQLVRVQPPKEPKSGKKAAGAAAEGATPAPGGEGGATPAAAAGAKKEKEAVPMQRVEAKSWEEVERQYREGTLKAHLVAVLKAVQPEALSVQDILDKAKEMGMEGLEEKGKAASQALATDPNFIRVSKGAYSLHCFHPDKEQLVRVQPPKEKKEKERAAGGEGATPAAPEPEKEAVPMIAVEAKSWEEVERQYKEGTLKAHLVAVLKAVQPEALSVQGIMDKGKELGVHEFEEKQKAAIGQALATDPNFIRVAKGAYSLHCFHPDKPNLIRDPAHKKRKMTDFMDEEEGGSKRHEGGAAAGGDQVVDSITRAEQLVRHTKRSLARHREALEKAQAEYDAAKAKWEEEKKLGKATPSKEAAKERRLSDVPIPPEQLARFELSDEERAFKGEADDRKGMLEHRQKLQARVKELEKAKKAFIEAERKKREAAAREAGKEAKAVEVTFRKAERVLEHERRAAETAEKATAAAEKKLEREKEKAARGEERAKEKEEREKQKAVEREERERRRAEKAKEKEEAKRYPLEDLELLEELRQKAAEAGEAAPPEDVAQPSWLTPEDSHRLCTSLYVSDLVTQFAKQLGVKALHYDSFERVLADATGKGERPAAGDDLGAGTLHTLYERLIEVILEDLRAEDLATPQEKRWALLLGAGTWPEVLRRLVLTRAADEDNPDQRPDQPAVMAASMLAFDPVDRLTHDQHLALLRFLCDSVLDTEKMRGILQRRQDEAEDAMRDVRGEVAEQRKQLKELLDAEKEERRRKREERRKEEEEKAAAAAPAAGEGQPVDGPAGEGRDGEKGSGAAAMDVDGQDQQQEQEPSFELPERLREYTGPADDRKALVQWRQEQQAEKRRLEKERNKWIAEQLRRQRELEAKEKAARAEQELREKEKREMFEAIEQAQEELEEKLEKYATRRLPLGFDRHQRRYWWGLAGHRPVVWVEDAEGRWGAYSTATELEGLMASLDRRGVRELALVEALEKKYHTITGAMARAERAAAAAEKAGTKGADKEKERERAEPPRRSGRTAQQVEFFDPAKAAKGGPSAGLAALFGPAETVAAEAAAEVMQDLQKGAAGVHVDAPAGYDSWKDWGSAVKAAAEGELEESSETPTAAALRSLLQGKLQQLEEALLAASVGGLSADGDESDGEGSGEAGEGQGSEGGSPAGDGGISRTQSAQVLPPEEVVDDLFSPTQRHEARYLWKTQRERSAWLTDLRQAATAARIAYCAAVLEQQAEPMLASLAKAGGKGSGGKKGGKAAAAGKAAAGSSKAAAAAGSRPVSRANSAANLEAAAAEGRGSGKGGGKAAAAAAASGKRRGPPLPDNMRQTRSRH